MTAANWLYSFLLVFDVLITAVLEVLLLFRSHCLFIDSQVFQLKLWILLDELVFIKRGHPSWTPYTFVSEQWGREMIPWNWGYYWIVGCTFYAKGWFSRSWGNFCGWQKNVITTHLLLTGSSSSSPAYVHCPHSLPSVGSMHSLNGNVFSFWPHLTTFQVLLRCHFLHEAFSSPQLSRAL